MNKFAVVGRGVWQGIVDKATNDAYPSHPGFRVVDGAVPLHVMVPIELRPVVYAIAVKHGKLLAADEGEITLSQAERGRIKFELLILNEHLTIELYRKIWQLVKFHGYGVDNDWNLYGINGNKIHPDSIDAYLEKTPGHYSVILLE